MAKTITCDRCQQVLDAVSHKGNQHWVVQYGTVPLEGRDRFLGYDMCGLCITALGDWIKAGKEN